MHFKKNVLTRRHILGTLVRPLSLSLFMSPTTVGHVHRPPSCVEEFQRLHSGPGCAPFGFHSVIPFLYNESGNRVLLSQSSSGPVLFRQAHLRSSPPLHILTIAICQDRTAWPYSSDLHSSAAHLGRKPCTVIYLRVQNYSHLLDMSQCAFCIMSHHRKRLRNHPAHFKHGCKLVFAAGVGYGLTIAQLEYL